MTGCSAATARPPSSGTIGIRLNRFRKNPTKARATRSSEPDASPAIQNAAAPDGTENRPGERDARLLPGVVRQLLHPDHGAEEGDEERRARRHALPAQLDHVPDLVDEDQDDEPDRERQSPDPGVGADRDEHRGAGRHHLELEEESAELDDEERQPDERGGELAQEAHEPAARVHRLVAAGSVLGGSGFGRVGGSGASRARSGDPGRRSRVQPHDPRPIHSSPPS